MFGFPFVTSLIVVMVLVTVFSFVINTGISIHAKKGKELKVGRATSPKSTS